MKTEHEIKRLDGTRIGFILKGLLIGVIVGFVVSLFRLGIEELSHYLTQLYHFFRHEPQWLLLWIPISILLAVIVGLLVKSDPDIKGSGIPQVEGQLRGQIHMRWWSVLWKKFIGGIISVGSGLFLGREGPSIQLGAMVGLGYSQMRHTTKSEEKIFVSSGASAGLAAAFNAPIAGLLFVLEEVHHNFSPLVWLTSFAAAISANFVSLNFFGLKPVLAVGQVDPLPLKYYGFLVLLGIFLGILGWGYQKVLLALPKFYGKLTFLSPNFYGLVPFLLIIPIGLAFPDILGGGNQIVLELGKQAPTIWIVLGLFLLRFVFSMISYGANLPGGIFLPILTLGALIGTFFGLAMVQFFGMDPHYVKNFLIIAMAGYFTAIGKAPLTAMILVSEMVGSLSHLMSLGLVALISYVVVDFLGGKPIYETLLERLVASEVPSITGKKTIIEYPITAESSLDGQMVRDFAWPKDMLLTSIRRGESELLTHGDTVMHSGDVLLILTDEGISQKIKQEITQRTYSLEQQP
ncbi:voltage-gated chloride channel family protein [Enterococcus canis]|uniref:Voltage-gated chloride channel family protein n=1 Tax=Enterococcus canis TaxID=214095 RepID=A0A1L8RIU0_9ENTE|nr:ClC family H(+)/Cl(-) exchange transporter [Enterococcus canis]OJG19653.1 voltage-gated chloride channel family protein [Enterococcus canis]